MEENVCLRRARHAKAFLGSFGRTKEMNNDFGRAKNKKVKIGSLKNEKRKKINIFANNKCR